MAESLSCGGSQTASSREASPTNPSHPPLSSRTNQLSSGHHSDDEPVEKRAAECGALDFSLKTGVGRKTSVIMASPSALGQPLHVSLSEPYLPPQAQFPLDPLRNPLLAAALASQGPPFPLPFPNPYAELKPPDDEAAAYHRFLISAHAIAAARSEMWSSSGSGSEASTPPHVSSTSDAQTENLHQPPSVITTLPKATHRPDVQAAVGSGAMSEGQRPGPAASVEAKSSLDERSSITGRSLPESAKDSAYWERRRKNNEAAKRSRDSRRLKEEEVAQRAHQLEQENIRLRSEVAQLKQETQQIRSILFTAAPARL